MASRWPRRCWAEKEKRPFHRGNPWKKDFDVTLRVADVTHLSRSCHAFFTPVFVFVCCKSLIFATDEHIIVTTEYMHCTMKTFIYSLLTIVALAFTSCNRSGQTQQIVTEQATKAEEPLSIKEELLQAHELCRQAGKIKDADKNNSQNKQRSLEIYNQAIYHYANVVVRDDSSDTLRIVALHNMRWIEAHQKHNYDDLRRRYALKRRQRLCFKTSSQTCCPSRQTSRY